MNIVEYLIYLYIYIYVYIFIFTRAQFCILQSLKMLNYPNASEPLRGSIAQGITWFIPIGQTQGGPYLVDG